MGGIVKRNNSSIVKIYKLEKFTKLTVNMNLRISLFYTIQWRNLEKCPTNSNQ